MRAPAFWDAPAPGIGARLLAPAAFLYGRAAAQRMRRPGTRAAVPVICVGNFTVGGTGKTPTALALAGLLDRAGRAPAFLTRGYGGRLAGPVRVDPARHRAPEVGDEPLLLARAAPTVVARDRPAGARLCVEAGAGVIVMDDGLQNPSLVKDLALAVLDAGAGLGNGRVLPAGPLRGPLAAQWPLVDAVVLIGEGPAGEAAAGAAARAGKPVLRAALVPEPAAAAALRGRRVLAFAGIGRPEKFFATLAACGAGVVRARAFPDHHPYGEREIRALLSEAARDALVPVTTEKDRVRIAALGADLAHAVAALPVTLSFADEAPLQGLLARPWQAGQTKG